MAATYQHASDSIPGYPPFSGVIRVADGKFIACAAGSQEWQDYLTWAAVEGNVPDPYLSPAAGGVVLVPAPDQPVYGSMLESLPPAGQPVMVDVPAMGGTGAVGEGLRCTMGNWQNEPTLYEWRWLSDAPADLSSGDTYFVRDTDVGYTIVCVVTATNEYGSTTAPPSNGVMAVAEAVEPVAAKAKVDDEEEHGERHRAASHSRRR